MRVISTDVGDDVQRNAQVLPDIAKELRVQGIVEGSVARSSKGSDCWAQSDPRRWRG